MGTARARRIVDTTADDVHRGLARILTGAIGGASQDLDGTALAPFTDVIRAAWRLGVSSADLAASTTQIAQIGTEPNLQEAVRHIGAAVVHRLPRHPLTLANAAGATGAIVRYVIGGWNVSGATRSSHRRRRPSLEASWTGAIRPSPCGCPPAPARQRHRLHLLDLVTHWPRPTTKSRT